MSEMEIKGAMRFFMMKYKETNDFKYFARMVEIGQHYGVNPYLGA